MESMEKRYKRMRAANGRYRLNSLFWEYRFISKNEDPVFTLADYDKSETCKSMYLIYMNCDTEYEVAMETLGSWEHWQELCKSNFFKKHLNRWREERKVRDEAIAHKTLLREAQNGNVTAAKAILAENKPTRGRPSKQEKAQKLDEEREIEEFLMNNIKVIK